MFLQGNLPLEFKESGTLLGRFWRRIWNWEDCFWLEDLKKEKIRRKEIGKFSFFGNKFRSWGMIYIGEKRKRREEGASRIGVWEWEEEREQKRDFSWGKRHAWEEGKGDRSIFLKIFGDRLEGKYRERDWQHASFSFEAEQFSSKIGSSRYGHVKFAFSHLYMILNIIFQVPMSSYWLLWRIRTDFSLRIYLSVSMLCFGFWFLVFLISIVNGWCMGLSLILIFKNRSLFLWYPHLFFFFSPLTKQWNVAFLDGLLYAYLSSVLFCFFVSFRIFFYFFVTHPLPHDSLHTCLGIHN